MNEQLVTKYCIAPQHIVIERRNFPMTAYRLSTITDIKLDKEKVCFWTGNGTKHDIMNVYEFEKEEEAKDFFETLVTRCI
jgi:hypothetical protein